MMSELSPTEAVALCRIAKALFPAQHFDQYTPKAWQCVLADRRFVDCEEAIFEIGKREQWCQPAEIRAEVARIRNRRIDAAPPLVPPPDLDDLGYRRWLRETRAAIADGETPPLHPLGNCPPPAIEGTFWTVPNA